MVLPPVRPVVAPAALQEPAKCRGLKRSLAETEPSLMTITMINVQ